MCICAVVIVVAAANVVNVIIIFDIIVIIILTHASVLDSVQYHPQVTQCINC